MHMFRFLLLLQVFQVRKTTAPRQGNIYAMKVLKKVCISRDVYERHDLTLVLVRVLEFVLYTCTMYSVRSTSYNCTKELVVAQSHATVTRLALTRSHVGDAGGAQGPRAHAQRARYSPDDQGLFCSFSFAAYCYITAMLGVFLVAYIE